MVNFQFDSFANLIRIAKLNVPCIDPIILQAWVSFHIILKTVNLNSANSVFEQIA